MKGDVITEHQFYEQVKSNPSAQQVLLNLTIQKVFEKQYGSEVDDKEVNDTIAEEEKQYGENYQRVLSQAGMTLETRKAQIRTSKLVELAVKKAAEAELTDDAYKKAFDEYTPDVTAQIIRLDNEDKAKEVLEKAKASGADFAQLAKDNSTAYLISQRIQSTARACATVTAQKVWPYFSEESLTPSLTQDFHKTLVWLNCQVSRLACQSTTQLVFWFSLDSFLSLVPLPKSFRALSSVVPCW